MHADGERTAARAAAQERNQARRAQADDERRAEIEAALFKIADLGRNLAEEAWKPEGTVLVGARICQLATDALDRVRDAQGDDESSDAVRGDLHGTPVEWPERQPTDPDRGQLRDAATPASGRGRQSVRVRDARGDDEATEHRHHFNCKTGMTGRNEDCDCEPEVWVRRAVRSPQGEDHEARVETVARILGRGGWRDEDGVWHEGITVRDWSRAADIVAALDDLSRVSAPKADENQEASQNDERRP